MGIATKALQLEEMAAGHIGGGNVCEVLEQRDGLGHTLMFSLCRRGISQNCRRGRCDSAAIHPRSSAAKLSFRA